MKMVRYLVIASLIAFVPVVQARLKSKSLRSTEKISFAWWPRETFHGVQNNISLTVRALSEDETNDLFLGSGRYLLKMRGCFSISQPIVPLHIIIENKNDFPVILNEKNINLGKDWIHKFVPVNLANVLESLSRQRWSSQLIVQSSSIYDYKGNFVGTTTDYKTNDNPLFSRSFFMLDTFSLSNLFNLEPSIFCSDNVTRGSVLIKENSTQEVLLFVWGKEITPKFSITIVKNIFNVDLCTPSSDIKK